MILMPVSMLLMLLFMGKMLELITTCIGLDEGSIIVADQPADPLSLPAGAGMAHGWHGARHAGRRCKGRRTLSTLHRPSSRLAAPLSETREITSEV